MKEIYAFLSRYVKEPPSVMLVIVGILLALFALAVVVYLKTVKRKKKSSVKTLIVLGSGGHTTEMVRLVSALDWNKYSPRIYVHATTDSLSAERTRAADPEAEFAQVPRAREVKQSWATSVLTTAAASVNSYLLLLRIGPDLILCNGPGTCVPFCAGAWLNNKMGLSRTKIVFVESVCRVKSLSLSGKIVSRLADETLVQWPELAENCAGNVRYAGRF